MSIYNITLADVLVEWWKENANNRFQLIRSVGIPVCRISCKTCHITWIRIDPYDRIEYALVPSGGQYYLELADPQLFEKLTLVLKTVTHDPDFKCSND